MRGLRPRGPIDVVGLAFRSLWVRPLRTLLTALSVAAAVASIAFVAAVGGTVSNFVLKQIKGVGSNLVYAYYEPGGGVSEAEADFINFADVEAVRARLGDAATAVSGVTTSWDSLVVEGRPKQVRVLGSNESYRLVRNLTVSEGRFLERRDLDERARVALVTPDLATLAFGRNRPPVGQRLQLHGMDFEVIGVFEEGVETFGQSEVNDNSALVPHTVAEYFLSTERIDPLYVAAESLDHVDEVAATVLQTLQSRHRPGSLYKVATLSGLLDTAERILAALRAALFLAASVTLALSGVFIAITMVIGVSERTFEIGIRKALGATRREIRLQFLTESVLLGGVGGVVGAVSGLVMLWTAASFRPNLEVHIPFGWTGLGLLAAVATGVVFGWLPAARASRLDPVEALRRE